MPDYQPSILDYALIVIAGLKRLAICQRAQRFGWREFIVGHCWAPSTLNVIAHTHGFAPYRVRLL